MLDCGQKFVRDQKQLESLVTKVPRLSGVHSSGQIESLAFLCTIIGLPHLFSVSQLTEED